MMAKGAGVDISSLDYDQLLSLQAAAAAHKRELLEESRARTKAQIDELLRESALVISDLYPQLLRPQARGGKGRQGTVPIKYVDSENVQNVWTGRGRAPRWFVQALKNGKSEEELKVS